MGLVETHGVERIVLAGEPRNVAVFRKGLPARVAGLVAGAVTGARHETASVLVGRATALLSIREGARQAADVDAVLTEAAKGGQAVAGLEPVLEAVNRGAIHRLYLLKGLSVAGGACRGCGALQPGPDAACRFCGKETRTVELGGAVADRVVAAEGKVETVEAHQALEGVGGVAARVRYPV
jgi:peptide subunit release factor 1 (eRF1)